MVGESPNLRQAALGYAAKSWPVFPCQPGSKIPLTPHGYHDATTDIFAVEEWWFRWPSANIGCPTGIAFDVVDFDTAPLYWANFPLSGPQSATGRGYHWFIQPNWAKYPPSLRRWGRFQGIGRICGTSAIETPKWCPISLDLPRIPRIRPRLAHIGYIASSTRYPPR